LRNSEDITPTSEWLFLAETSRSFNKTGSADLFNQPAQQGPFLRSIRQFHEQGDDSAFKITRTTQKRRLQNL